MFWKVFTKDKSSDAEGWEMLRINYFLIFLSGLSVLEYLSK